MTTDSGGAVVKIRMGNVLFKKAKSIILSEFKLGSQWSMKWEILRRGGGWVQISVRELGRVN